MDGLLAVIAVEILLEVLAPSLLLQIVVGLKYIGILLAGIASCGMRRIGRLYCLCPL